MRSTSGKQGETDKGNAAIGVQEELLVKLLGLLIVDNDEVQAVFEGRQCRADCGVRIDLLGGNLASAGRDLAALGRFLDLPGGQRAKHDAILLSLSEGGHFFAHHVFDQLPQRNAAIPSQIRRGSDREIGE